MTSSLSYDVTSLDPLTDETFPLQNLMTSQENFMNPMLFSDINLSGRGLKGRYGCHLCNKRFTRKSTRERHLQTHLGYRFFCSTCGKSFRDNYSLKVHGCNTDDGNKDDDDSNSQTGIDNQM